MTNFNNQDQQTIMQRLQAPFPASDIEFRVGSTNADKTRGMALAYLTSRAIQSRLDEVFGIGGWQTQFDPWKEKGTICTLSVKIDGEWISKQDAAEDTEFEEIKGGISSALKRCAVHYGIGRYLYSLEAQWVSIKKAGNSYVFTQKPTLPDWALPGGESQLQNSTVAPFQAQASRPVTTNIIQLEDKTQTEPRHEEKCACAVCGKRNVTPKAKKYSTERWGKAICFNCQQEGQLGPANQKVSGNPVPVLSQSYYESGEYRQPFDQFDDENDEVPF